VGIDILAVQKAVKPFDKQGTLVLLIHSPAMSFAGEEDKAPGRTYSFRDDKSRVVFDLPADCWESHQFSEGIAWFITHRHQYGCYDRDGKFIGQESADFTDVHRFAE
jgi:hypothetical protein